jgi:phosphatidylserine decarboxylase
MTRTTYFIAREGWSCLIILVAITLCIGWVSHWHSITLLFCAALVFSAYVFRNPERIPAEGDDLAIIAPIDGIVEHIESTPKHITLIFSVPLHGAHYLRAPMTGKILKKETIKGILLPISHSLSKKLNERSSYVFAYRDTHLTLQSVASIFSLGNGFYKQEEEKVQKGERVGFFLHGKVTMQLPITMRLKINSGDSLIGGETLLGFLKESNEKTPS